MNRYVTSIVLSAFLSSALLIADDSLDIKTLQADVEAMKAELEGNAKSGFQLAGYASFDWTDTQGGDSDFSGVKFAPIFHYQYSDLFQFEGELEIETSATGETEVVLEYAAGTLFLNDYMGLQMGKFMSPLGQFVQNVHPSWINKFATAPVGFGHDGAAPSSNVGVALRGGLPALGSIRSNYVAFVSNAPTFTEHGIQAEGTTSSAGAAKTWGARFAVNPVGSMEIGVSGAVGEVSEDLAGTLIARDYDVFGVDFMYNINNLDLKAEYIQQTVGENSNSALEGGIWKAAYVQAAYQFPSLKLEPVLRYSNFKSPEGEKKQSSIGLNYLFANNVIAKVSYDINDNTDNAGASVGNDSANVQLAFGF